MKIPSEGGWTFESEEIASGFDKHVREQLPWYDLATNAVAHIARHYLPDNGTLYDIGASTGNITVALSETIAARKIKVFAVEPSKEMAAKYKGAGLLTKQKAEDVFYESFDVAVIFLTMMFIPVKKRKSFLENLLANLNEGGCIIIFDKTPPAGGYLGTILYRLTLAGKIAAGVSGDEVVKKELSLAGRQIPYSCDIEGAKEVFRFGDFVGWVIESPKGK